MTRNEESRMKFLLEKIRAGLAPLFAAARWLARHDKLFAAGALAVLAALLFWPVLFGGRTLLGCDFGCFFHSMKFFYRESVLNGDFPFWYPYALQGVPLLAGWQQALLYPLSVVWIVFPTSQAYGVFATAHCWLFAWFVWLLARECRAGGAGAWVSGCGAVCAGVMLIGSYGCTEHIAGMTWLPLVLGFYLGLLRSGGWKQSVGLAVAGALMMHGGSPYPLLMTMVMLAVCGPVFWWRLRERPPVVRVLWRGAAGAGLSVLLAAPTLLPVLELARQVPSEFLARNPADQAHYSLLPMDWLRLLVPTLYGFPNAQPYYPGVLAVFLGLAGVALAAARRWRWNAPASALAALALAGVVMAGGPLLRLDRLLALVPMVSRLYSYPQMISWLAAIALPVLAGLAARPLRRLSVGGRWWVAGVALGAALVALLLESPLETWAERMRRLPRFVHEFKSFTARTEAYPVKAAVNRFLALWVCAAGAALLLAGARRRRALTAALAVVAALCLADGALLVRDLRLFGKTDVYAVETPSMRALREAGAGHELARLHRTYPMLGETHIVIGSSDPREFAWARDFLPWSVGVTRHFSQTNSSGTLNPPEADYVWQRLLDRFEPWQNDRLRGLWNAKWVMDIKRGAGGYSYQLRENPQFMPRAWLSARARTVRDWREALGLLLDKNFDPRRTALLYAPQSEVPGKLLGQPEKFSAVADIRQTNNTITVRASSGTDAVLVVASTYYKWWRATVDGKPARVFKANMAQKAVLFPAGEHTVRLVCVPVSFYVGCGLFAVGALAIALFLSRSGRGRRADFSRHA